MMKYWAEWNTLHCSRTSITCGSQSVPSHVSYVSLISEVEESDFHLKWNWKVFHPDTCHDESMVGGSSWQQQVTLRDAITCDQSNSPSGEDTLNWLFVTKSLWVLWVARKIVCATTEFISSLFLLRPIELVSCLGYTISDFVCTTRLCTLRKTDLFVRTAYLVVCVHFLSNMQIHLNLRTLQNVVLQPLILYFQNHR